MAAEQGSIIRAKRGAIFMGRKEHIGAAVCRTVFHQCGPSRARCGQPLCVDEGAHGAAVPLAIEGGAAYVRADPADLHEAIGNLVENALKYGTHPQVGIARENGTAVVRVRDSGPGIAAEDADKIFERFHRSADSREIPGSGLGLTIAAGAAKRAGGTLVLEDASAGHTTFALRLPVVIARPGRGER